jgi:hypothetical protein
MSTMQEASDGPAPGALIDVHAGKPAVVRTPGRQCVTNYFFDPFPAWYAACVVLECQDTRREAPVPR